MSTFGELLKSYRIRKELTLRECSQRLNIDPSNWSKMERDINPAPKSEDVLATWSNEFGLNPEEQREFLDAAAISRRELPQDMASNEKILEALPVFFRVARGAEMTEEKLNQFVETIRQLHSPDKDAFR